MLVKHKPDAFEKLHILGGMASDDILSRPQPTQGSKTRSPYNSRERNPLPGIYKAAMPNGKTISLFRTMFTDFCKYDCHYCPNSNWVPRKRFAWKVDELVNSFMELHQRHAVSGLFLSSGIAGSGSKTTERLLKVVDSIRNKHKFAGYIHMKVMPGTDYQYVEEAYRLGTRLSINIETPTIEMLDRISPMKNMQQDILDPMDWVDKLIKNRPPLAKGVRSLSSGGNNTATKGTIGQATQMVVGAASESDWDIFQRIDQLYTDWNFKRVYYSPFQPVRYTPLEELPATLMIREHRLYQVDWLKRIYKFSNDELKLAYDDNGFLAHDEDPKTAIAIENLDKFPMDVNQATKEDLLRVPGVGPTSTERILKNRRAHSIDNWRDLQAMGVVRKRAWPFLFFPGHRPPRAKQLKLDMFGEGAKQKQAQEIQAIVGASAPGQPTAPCGDTRSCTGCPMFGAPGHPGHPNYN